jgi:hypothetical protein
MVCYDLVYFLFWYVWTKKNLATLVSARVSVRDLTFIFLRQQNYYIDTYVLQSKNGTVIGEQFAAKFSVKVASAVNFGSNDNLCLEVLHKTLAKISPFFDNASKLLSMYRYAHMHQGCQMVYVFSYQKSHIFDIFGKTLEMKISMYFMVILVYILTALWYRYFLALWYIFRTFGIFLALWYIYPFRYVAPSTIWQP